MRFPSSCLCFGPSTNHTVTVGTHNKDQADRATELIGWIVQQEQTLQAMYGEEVELSHSPLLLEEMEECFSETDWAALDFGPSRNRSSPAHTTSKPRSPRCKGSTPAAAAPAELVMPTAASLQLSAAAVLAKLVTPTAASPQLTLTVASAEPSSPPPAAAKFPAEFSSRPGRRRRGGQPPPEGFGRTPPMLPRSVHPPRLSRGGFLRYGSRPDRRFQRRSS
ncbi:hypothetical protein CRENBAI_010304 [Crenichthys baileyi]|uniref:Uncharacterized protein n=1 Tax=Crenichthys baileyi TaxID=28760 RepID=A0AAV9RFR0_9TELE